MNLNKAKESLEILFGVPPHNIPSNICWNDAYFAKDIERKFGKSIEELCKLTGVKK